MRKGLPEEVRALLEGRNWAYLATIMPDGSPHVHPVWADLEGNQVLVNTTKGMRKERNARRDPRIAIDVVATGNQETYAAISGRVVEITDEGAEEHIDRLAKKYLGVDRYPWRQPGDERVILRIDPEHIYLQIYDPVKDHHDLRTIRLEE